MREKSKFAISLVLMFFLQNGFSCAVCLGNISENEIIAYTFSVIFLAALIILILYLIFKKVVQNYDLDL
jgi:hypothetical protein